MKKTFVAVLGAAAAAGAAHGALVLTNGNFETGGGNNIENVTGWFDNSNGTFWQGTWVTNNGAVTPNATNVVILGSYEGSGIQNTASANALVGNWLYQSIGTIDGGNDAVRVDFDFGQPNDDNGGRTLGLTVAVYAFDGVGTFVAGDNVDLYAASQTSGTGVTLLDFESFQYNSVNLDNQISAYQSTLSLSAAGSQEIFLSFNNYRPAATESWGALDNVAITAVPEPAAALLGGLGLIGLLRRRRG